MKTKFSAALEECEAVEMKRPVNKYFSDFETLKQTPTLPWGSATKYQMPKITPQRRGEMRSAKMEE